MLTAKKIIFFFCLTSFVNVYVHAQENYSRFYDLEAGSDNRPQALLLEDDSFILSSTHSGTSSVVSALTRFDMQGDIISLDTIEDFVVGIYSSLLKKDQGYDLVGCRWSLDSTGARGINIYDLNDDLEIQTNKSIYFEEARSATANGIYENDDEVIVTGRSINQNPNGRALGHLFFLNKEDGSVTKELILPKAEVPTFFEYRITEFQKTVDGNYVYLTTHDETGDFLSTPRMFEIVKIDPDGNLLGSISNRETVDLHFGLVQDEQSNVYFYSKWSPYEIDAVVPFSVSSGGLVKVNSDLDSVLWNITFNEPFDPDNPTTLSRTYDAKGMITLSDGNFLAYGRALGTLNATPGWGGFVTKFTPDGEVLWIRSHHPELDKALFSLNNDQEHKTSSLKDCHELPDGRILCAGSAGFVAADTSYDTEVWILMLDDEGCIGSDCGDDLLSSTTTSEWFKNSGYIYPNPTANTLHIEDVVFEEYIIYDLMGKVKMQGGFTSEVNLQDLNSGMYILQLKQDGKLISSFKFSKVE